MLIFGLHKTAILMPVNGLHLGCIRGRFNDISKSCYKSTPLKQKKKS